MRATLVVVAVITTSCGRSEAPPIPEPIAGLCQSIYGKPLVNQTLTPRDRAKIAWPSGACIAVTHEPQLKPSAQALHAALETWASVPGTSLCFELPGEASTAPVGAERRIHVVHLAPGGVTAVISTLNYNQATGQLQSGQVAVDTTYTISPGAWLKTAGRLLGFDSTPGVETVMNELTTDTRVTELTEADRQSVLSVYPACL